MAGWTAAEWKRRLQAKDSEDQTEAFHELGNYLYRVAYKMLATKISIPPKKIEELAHELAQKTIVIVWEKLDEFRWEARVTTWAVRILQTEILQLLRSSRFRREVNLDFSSDQTEEDEEYTIFDQLRDSTAIPTDNLPESVTVTREFIALMAEILKELKPKYRTVLVECLVREIPISDYAAAEGITEINAYKRLSRAKQQAREMLLVAGYDPAALKF
jgi:RNA polymerase sigma factor (sigma-70 family)